MSRYQIKVQDALQRAIRLAESSPCPGAPYGMSAALLAHHPAFHDAGRPVPSMRLVMEWGQDPDFTRWLPDVTVSIHPQMERLDLPIDRPGHHDTLQQRLPEEVASSRTVVPWLALVGAWCRTRAN